jgi:hypothetical protein
MSAFKIFTILDRIAMIPPCGFDGLVRFDHFSIPACPG